MSTSSSMLADKKGNGFELRAIDCPTCGVADRRVLGWRGGHYHRYGEGVPTRIVQCKECALIFPDPFPYPQNIQELYSDPESYFAAHDEGAKIIAYRELIRKITKLIRERRQSTKLTLLDVGSGRGELLEAARLEGIDDVVGLELSEAMIKYARTRFDATVLPTTIEEYAKKGERVFDAITLNAVLEHTHDPDAMIAAAKALTTPGGVLYIDVPMEPNLLTVVGNTINKARRSEAVFNLSPTWPPYHVFGFNRRALTTLLSKHGFEITDVRIFAHAKVPAKAELQDRAKAFVATQINRLANVTRTASNMYVWAHRR